MIKETQRQLIRLNNNLVALEREFAGLHILRDHKLYHSCSSEIMKIKIEIDLLSQKLKGAGNVNGRKTYERPKESSKSRKDYEDRYNKYYGNTKTQEEWWYDDGTWEYKEEEKPKHDIPDGWHVAIIVESDYRENSKGAGWYLYLVFKIVVEGINKTINVYLNLENPSEFAVKMANMYLDKICNAIGKKRDEINDSVELHNIPLKILVKNIIDNFNGLSIIDYKPIREDDG